jgi:LacI family transcriptional regulator
MAAAESGLPMVFVDRLPPEGVPGDFVGTDNFFSARDAVQHLIQLGHQRIACAVNLDSSSSVHDRVAGFRAALEAAGLSSRDEVRPLMTMDGDMRKGFEETLRPLMDSPNRPTAIFAINDMVALIVHDILVGWGYAVPGDVSLVGFDGEMRWIPGGGYLTTMVQNFERMGELAMTLLIDRIEGRLKGPSRCYFLEAPLAQHASSGPPPSSLLQEGTSISL